MDDIALMQEIAEALGKELLGRPVPQMGISTAASAPGSVRVRIPRAAPLAYPNRQRKRVESPSSERSNRSASTNSPL